LCARPARAWNDDRPPFDQSAVAREVKVRNFRAQGGCQCRLVQHGKNCASSSDRPESRRNKGLHARRIAPGLPPIYDRDLLRAGKQQVPRSHVHAFSPLEVRFGAHKRKMSTKDFMPELKEAGLGSMPGAAAETLDVEVRKKRTCKPPWRDTDRRVGLPFSRRRLRGRADTVEMVKLIRRAGHVPAHRNKLSDTVETFAPHDRADLGTLKPRSHDRRRFFSPHPATAP
jgi:hypothetical protein